MIAFGTVVYNNAISFLNEFVDDINQQTSFDFDLLVINDDIDKVVLDNILSRVNKKVIVVNKYGSGKTPVELRIELLKEAKIRDYDLLVLGDCDDRFDKKRVELIKDSFIKYKDYSFFYNNLCKFDGKPALKEMPQETNSISNVLQHNYLGLSNSSISLSQLSIDFINSLHECNSFVFDWYLFSRIICNGGKGLYINDAITFYRIYENNYAGVSNEIQLRKEINVKSKHYKLMSKYDKVYNVIYEKLLKLDNQEIQINKSCLTYWWDNIKIED